MIYELIGYLASVLIAVSLLMVNIIKLRLINLLGCLAFITYGILIGSLPIVISNGFILLINIYYLKQLLGHDLGAFTYLPLGESRKSQVFDFIEAFGDDIRLHFPLFTREMLEPAFGSAGKVYLAVRHLKPVGLSSVMPMNLVQPGADADSEEKEIFGYVNSELFPESSYFVLVDYIQKKYRNIGVDRKLYNLMLQELPAECRFLITLGETANRGNDRYLKKNGYRSLREFRRFTLYVKSRAD